MSEHWYTRDGKPSHTRISKSGVIRSTTLRDARLERLLPSVSSVLNEAAAPELDRWKANKILEACYSSGDPLAVAPTLSEYSAMIREKADKEMEQAQVFGTAFHKAMEGEVPVGMELLVEATNKSLDTLKIGGLKVEEQEVAVTNLFLGYAGTTDYAFSEGGLPGILDFKTCKTEKDEPIAFKRSHCAQIAAYIMAKYRTNCTELPEDETVGINIYVSKTEPGRIDVVRYDQKQLHESWEWFKACLTLWRLRRGYDPREVAS
jgi:hypothetical protein